MGIKKKFPKWSIYIYIMIIFVVPYIIKRNAWLQIYNFNFEKKKKTPRLQSVEGVTVLAANGNRVATQTVSE